MANEKESRIEIDATPAVEQLQKLSIAIASYNKTLARNEKETGIWNAANRSSAQTLESLIGDLEKVEQSANAVEKAFVKLTMTERRLLAEEEKRKKALGEVIKLTRAQAAVKQVNSELNIGANAPRASADQIAKLNKAQDAFVKLTASANITNARIAQITKNLAANYTGADRIIRDAILRIVKANDQLGVKGNSAFSGLENSLNKVTLLAKGFLAFRIGAKVTREFTDAVRAANDFEISLAEIQTVAEGPLRNNIDDVGNVVSGLAAKFGKSGTDVAESLYQALSNQVGNTAETVRFLDDALKFSVATNSSAKDSVELLTGVLRAYNKDASEAGRVSDILFKTIEVGRVRADELANTYGRILPLAKTLGVSFEEVSLLVAKLTNQGVSADDALTQLLNVFIGLAKPSEDFSKIMKDLGVESARAGVAMFGLKGFLDQVIANSDGSVESLASLYTEIRRLRGVIGITAEGFDELEQKFKNFEGAADAAFKIIDSTPAQKLNKEIAALETTLTNIVGRGVLEAIASGLENVGGADRSVKDLATAFLVLLPVIEEVTSGVAILAMGVAQLADNFGLVDTEKFRRQLDLISKSQSDITDALIADSKKESDAKILESERSTQAILQNLRSLNKAYSADRDAALGITKTITEGTKQQLRERISAVDSLVTQIRNKQEGLVDRLKDLNQQQVGFDFDINQKLFNLDTSNLSDPQRGQALLKRSQDLVKKSREALSKGNKEFASQLFQDAIDAANSAANIAQTKSAGRNQLLELQKIGKARFAALESEAVKESKVAAEIEKGVQASADRLRQYETELEGIQGKIRAAIKDGSESSIDDLSGLLQKQDEVAKKITGEVANVSSKGLFPDLDKIIQRDFRDFLTGKPVELSASFDAGFSKAFENLQKNADAVSVDFKIGFQAATGKQLPLSGGQDELRVAQQKAAENLSNLDAQVIKKQASIVELRRQSDAILLKVQEAIDARQQSIKLRGGYQSEIDAQVFDLEIASKRITFLQQQIDSAINTADPEKLRNLATSLMQVMSSLNSQGTEIPAFDKSLDTINRLGTDALKSAAEVDQLKQKLNEAKQILDTINRLDDVNLLKTDLLNQEQQKLGPAAQTGASQAVSALNSIGAAATQQVAAVRQLVQELQLAQAARSGPTQFASTGGQIAYLAGGGFVPRGTDTQPAMLTPGETVLNAQASRRFFSQVTAMNAGSSPQYHSDGGSVSNSFTGDIVINTQAQNVNGRQLGGELQRELRRRTINLGKR